jgi:hypothetical protein
MPTIFTPTQWKTAEVKAKFANHFIRFIDKDCPYSLFLPMVLSPLG